MDKQLGDIESKIVKQRNFESPPLDQWDPPLSGDISIRIARDGTWYHDGGEIRRESLVRLFASILRREEDGEYYLVTPAEKWRIEVELHPFLVNDIELVDVSDGQVLRATLNTGKQVSIGAGYPLFLEPTVGNVAALSLDHGLTALFSRASWYRLVAMSSEATGAAVVVSGDYRFCIS
jgi:hypothetical protein